MRRLPGNLPPGPFDLLVIGGGIYGSWVACHAARAGLRTALIERGDWGGGTSSASSKLLHGGLRYLEHFDFGLVRKSLRERKALHRIMPHHARPLRFLLPIYRGARVGRFKFKLGLWLYDRFAGAHQPVGPHRGFTPGDLCREEPALVAEGLTGGFDYGDCWMDDARMILEIVETAQAAGAVAVNYTEAVSLLEEGGRVTGAVIEDRESGERLDVRAVATLNAAGAWAERLAAAGAPIARYTKGVHLVMPPLQGSKALLLTAPRDGRVFFLIPWYGRTLLGTTDTDFAGDPDSARVEEADIAYLLEAAAAYLRPAWTRDDVLGSFCGLRTLRREEGKRASEVTREWSLERPKPGLWMPVGGKYTSARVEADEIVKAILKEKGWPHAPSLEDPPAMAWFPSTPYATWRARQVEQGRAAGLDDETAGLAVERHGCRFEGLLQRLRREPALARRLVPEAPFCRAEVCVAVEEEMARNLTDVLRRRIPVLILCRLREAEIEDAASLAAPHLGWDAARRRQEIEAVMEAKRRQLPFLAYPAPSAGDREDGHASGFDGRPASR